MAKPMAKRPKESQHNVEFAKGGKGGENTMFPQQSSDPAEKGQTRDTSRTDNLSDKFAVGGKGKMFGYTGALPARDGLTSAR